MAAVLPSAPISRVATKEDRQELAQFTCGPKADYEEGVDALVRKQAAQRSVRGERLLVFRHPQNDELVGVVDFAPQNLKRDCGPPART